MSITPGGTNYVACVRRCLGNAEDRHPAVRSLGTIAGLSVLCEERAVGIDERALRYWQEYLRVDNDRPMTAAPNPAAGAVTAPATDDDTDTDTDTDAAPPHPRHCHCHRWCQTSSLPRLFLALVFDANERCRRCHHRH